MPDQNEVLLSHAIVKVNGTDLPVKTLDKMTEFVVDSSLALPDMFVITFTDDDLSLVDSGPFMLGAPVEIEMGDNDERGSGQSVIKGEITAIEPDFDLGAIATLTIRG
jgi:hypothetical protein